MGGRVLLPPNAPFAPQFPPQTYAAPRLVSQPAPPPNFNNPAWQPGPALAQQQPASQPRPVFRAQQADEPVPAAAPLHLPSPEQLRVCCARPAEADAGRPDWNDTHQRLDRLGALGFHLDKVGRDGSHVTFLLPTAQPGKTHLIEATGATDAEAVRFALDRAELWAVRK
jgi:hypothetical protein